MALNRKPGCCCTTNPETICVKTCGGTIPVYGAVVDILLAGSPVATCTTGSTGCCQVSLAAGTYTVDVTVSGTLVFSAGRTLTPGGTVTISISSTGFVCCGGYAIPTSLTLTDAVGTLSFVYNSGFTNPVWFGGHSTTGLSCTVTTPGGICTPAPASMGPVRVCYRMDCAGTSSPPFRVQRGWSWVHDPSGVPTWYQDTTGFTPGAACGTDPPASCGSPLDDQSSFATNPSSTAPFTLSGTPAFTGSHSTADPVGGSVTISA